MNGKVVLPVAALALVGCAPTVWNKPGATEQDLAADRYGCEKDARQSQYFGGGIMGAINMHNFFKECLVAHGWTQEGASPLQGSPSAAAAQAAVDVRGRYPSGGGPGGAGDAPPSR
jgi:hypothetical protein